MEINSVLAALEEYFEIKRDIGLFIEAPNLVEARERAGKTLNEYIQKKFDHLLYQQEKRKNTSVTQKIVLPDEENLKFSWDNVASLLDALNSLPNPLPKDKLNNEEAVIKWMNKYEEWFKNKRGTALRSVTSSFQLELDLGELEEK